MSSMPFWHTTTLAPTATILSTMPFSIFVSSSRNFFIMDGSLMLSLASNSVFSISKGALISAILAFSTTFGIPEWTTSLSRTIPWTRLVSFREPPGFFSTLTLSMSTLKPLSTFSATAKVASTTRLARSSASLKTSFVCMLVLATLTSQSLLSGVTFSATSSRDSIAFLAAFE